MRGGIKIDGLEELKAALLKLPPELAKIAEASALREGMKPLRKAVQAKAASLGGTGLLARSIGMTVRRVRRKLQYQNRYTARVGARSGFGISKTVIARKTIKGRTKGEPYQKRIDPVNYAHLVEYGTSRTAAKPFLRPAIESSKEEITAGLARGYAKAMPIIMRKIRSPK